MSFFQHPVTRVMQGEGVELPSDRLSSLAGLCVHCALTPAFIHDDFAGFVYNILC